MLLLATRTLNASTVSGAAKSGMQALDHVVDPAVESVSNLCQR